MGSKTLQLYVNKDSPNVTHSKFYLQKLSKLYFQYYSKLYSQQDNWGVCCMSGSKMALTVNESTFIIEVYLKLFQFLHFQTCYSTTLIYGMAYEYDRALVLPHIGKLKSV